MNKIEIKISHPPEWPTKTIYEACQIVSRGTAPVYVENSTVLAIGQRCIREFGLQPEEARFHDQRSMTRVLKACKRDVLLNSTGTGTIGRSCIFNADGTYIIDGHVTLLRSDPDQLDGRWLNALLQSPQGQLHLETQCYSGSTNQVELSRERLSATSIPLPSLPEQHCIAEILDTIDQAIQKTETLISKLKAMKQGLLHDLLTRGLDKNGKLRDPKAHPEQFQDSPLGKIPKEWQVVSLGKISRVRRGASPRPIDNPVWFAQEGRGWIRISDVTRANGLLKETEQYLSSAGVNKSVSVYPGQIIMSICATIGESIILDMNACIHDGFVVFDQYDEFMCPEFFIHFLRYKQSYFKSQGQTGTQANLNTNIVRDCFIGLPILTEQKNIAKCLDYHDARIRTEEQYRDKLKLQKKGFMYDLLTGKIRVEM